MLHFQCFTSILELQSQSSPWMAWWSIPDDFGPYFFLEKVISGTEETLSFFRPHSENSLTQRISDGQKVSKHFPNSQNMNQMFRSGDSDFSPSSANTVIWNKPLKLPSFGLFISTIRWKNKMTLGLLPVLKLYNSNPFPY